MSGISATRLYSFDTNHSPKDDDQKKREEAITLSIQEIKEFHASLSVTIGKLELREENLKKAMNDVQSRLNGPSALKELIKSNAEFYAEMKAMDQYLATPISLSITPPFVKRIMRLFEKIFC